MPLNIDIVIAITGQVHREIEREREREMRWTEWVDGIFSWN